MTLAPPIMVVPGTCACSTDRKSCACMPEDAAQLMTDLSAAKYRADEATDPRERSRWAAERSRLAKKLNDAMHAMQHRADSARKDPVKTKNEPTISQRADALSVERRDEMIAELAQTCLEAGDSADTVHGHRDRLRGASNAFVISYCEGWITEKRKQIEANSRQRTDAMVREFSQVTDADREQAAKDLAVLYQTSPYASKHAARADEDDYARAVELRSRSIARQRVARENLDAMAGARAARKDATAPIADPYDPVTNGAGIWATPHDTKKGRR